MAKQADAEQKRARKTVNEGTDQGNQTKYNKIRTDKVHNNDEGKTVQLTCMDCVKQEADRINKNKRSPDNEQQKELGKTKITKNEHVQEQQ
eukprot:6964286-Heterocapsa_arctica.AAC.1